MKINALRPLRLHYYALVKCYLIFFDYLKYFLNLRILLKNGSKFHTLGQPTILKNKQLLVVKN